MATTISASEIFTPGTLISLVPSSSNPNKAYEVRCGHDGNVYCSCPAWKFQKKHPHDRTCKHIKAVLRRASRIAKAA